MKSRFNRLSFNTGPTLLAQILARHIVSASALYL